MKRPKLFKSIPKGDKSDQKMKITSPQSQIESKIGEKQKNTGTTINSPR